MKAETLWKPAAKVVPLWKPTAKMKTETFWRLCRRWLRLSGGRWLKWWLRPFGGRTAVWKSRQTFTRRCQYGSQQRTTGIRHQGVWQGPLGGVCLGAYGDHREVSASGPAWEPTPSSAPPQRGTCRNRTLWHKPTADQGAGTGWAWTKEQELVSVGLPPISRHTALTARASLLLPWQRQSIPRWGGATETPPRGTMYTEFFHNRKCFIAIRITGFNIL